MELELFGSVLGRCLSSLDTLTAAYLPEGIDDATAAAIVRKANELRPATPPYAILVSAGPEDLTDDLCIRVSPQNAIKYRQGDRLAVVSGKHPDLASFVQAFREVLGQNFPEGATQEVSPESVAQAAIAEIVATTGIGDVGWDRDAASHRLSECFSLLSSVHRELRQGTESWNTYWFRHVGVGLTRLVEKIAEMKVTAPHLSINDVFDRYTYAAFRMPRPNTSGPLKTSPGKIVEAMQDFWADESTIAMTTKALGNIAGVDDEHHSLENIDWSDFNRQLAADDNQAVALASYSPDGHDLTEAISTLYESEFIAPFGVDLANASLEVMDGAGRPLTTTGPSDSGAVSVALADFDAEANGFLSEEIRLRIPVLGGASHTDVESSRITFTTKSSKTHWSGGALTVDPSGALWAVGHVYRAGSQVPSRTIHFDLSLPADDTFAGKVSASLSFDVFLAASNAVGILHMALKAKGASGKPKYVGSDPHGGIVGVTMDGRVSRYRYIAWGVGDSSRPLYEGTEIPKLNGREGIFAIDAGPASLANILAGETTYELRSAESRDAPQSPIVAAVHRDRVAKDKPSYASVHSIRGLYESLLVKELPSDNWMLSMGHVVTPTDRAFPLEDLSPMNGLLMNGSMAGTWANITDFKVPDEILLSTEAEQFRAAFSELDVMGAMTTRDADGAIYVEWPSKTSWRDLWEHREDRLARYLGTYSDLVEKARWFGDPAGVFWATYPFSISAWATEPAAKCSAVLLSPLHPVRLAWLSGVESALWSSEWAEHLAGTVEGWNFPLIGPKEMSSGRMLAVPVETGDEQLFLGWSMLVRASIEGPEPLEAPDRVGDRPAPGSAASGLNATAVAAALRSYRKMNPHVSTLTVDLSAVSEATRLHEVDEVVLKEIEAWTGRVDVPLIGGARIWDSNRRSGEPPREQMASLVRSAQGVPLTWSRYTPDTSNMKRCNVRILQDAGVHVEVQSGQGRNLGVLGDVPLRRFEAVAGKGESKVSSTSHPTFRPEVGWEPFSRALRLIEGTSSSPQIVSKLFKANLVNESADWTVSGEALMNPSAMAEIVQHSSGGNQMLWEWRPPFLDASDDVPLLERRPFVSVARVPGSFRAQIRKLLSKAQSSTVSDEALDDLLGQLGARGVGLSSLLSMGGTHASGALGFYLAFALMNQIDEDSDNTYVLPIDACDNFLRALARGRNHGAQLRRADLLILRLSDSEITLSPIEIKFYGLGAEDPSGNLPGPADSAMSEPLDQVRATSELLASVSDNSRYIASHGTSEDKALWFNGFGALIEAAIRLRPGGSAEPEVLARRLDSLINGKHEIRAGQPLVCYFKHEATSADGSLFKAIRSPEDSTMTSQGGFGLLSANVGHAFKEVQDPKSDFVKEWGKLVRWALTNPVGDKHEASAAINLEDVRKYQGESAQPLVALAEHPFEPGSHSRAGNGVPAAVTVDGIKAQELTLPIDDAGQESTPIAESVILASKDSNLETSGAGDFINGIRGDGVHFSVGKVLGTLGDAEAEYWPSNVELNQMNIGVVGDLGTGKTQLLKALVYQLREGGRKKQETPVSLLVFDYKRDFQSDDFVSAVGGKILRPYRIPINIFALRDGYTPLAAYQRAQQFADVLDKIYGNIGPVQTDRLVTAIVNLYKRKGGNPPTLAEVLDEYSEDQKPDAVTSILKPFILGEIFSDEVGEMISFEEMIDNNVIVVALNEFGTDDNGKNALVVLFLNLYYDYMLNAKKWPFLDGNPKLRRLNSFLLVDEAVNIMKYNFPVLMNLMLQGREFGFGVILASQYLEHFKKDGRNYGQPLLTWFIHKVPSVTLKELQQLGLPNITADVAGKISTQKVHHALYSSLNFPGRFIEEVPFYRLLD